MRDVPQVSTITNEDVDVLVFMNLYGRAHRLSFGISRKELPDWAINGIGWIPVPVYDPSAKSPADRYEKFKNMSIEKIIELRRRNFHGENFDEMVDAL